MKTTFPAISLLMVTILGSITSLSSCQSNVTGGHSKSTQYFPNSVGDQWTYAVFDSSGQVTDTLQVSVQRTTTLANGIKANVWHYATTDSSYTRYVSQQADSVFFYRDSTGQYIAQKIVTPYKVSAWWNSPTNGYNISKLDTLKLTKGIKIIYYQIEVGAPITPSVPVNIKEKQLCVAPYVGIVKYTKYSTKHFLVIESQYQLLNYDLK